MNSQLAKSWFLRERISYVFYGPQERELGEISGLPAQVGLRDKYGFLNPVYSNKQVTIYKINLDGK